MTQQEAGPVGGAPPGSSPVVRMICLDGLVPYVRNARTHSEGQVAQIAASIREFGWTNPILVDGTKRYLASSVQ